MVQKHVPHSTSGIYGVADTGYIMGHKLGPNQGLNNAQPVPLRRLELKGLRLPFACLFCFVAFRDLPLPPSPPPTPPPSPATLSSALPPIPKVSSMSTGNINVPGAVGWSARGLVWGSRWKKVSPKTSKSGQATSKTSSPPPFFRQQSHRPLINIMQKELVA